MPEFFSSDGSYYLQFIVIFLVILVLLMGIVLLFRRVAGRGMSMTARSTNRSRQPRLGIVDIYELDRQRQLILLRRDNVEHLLLVGGPNDVVVERNVIRGAGSRLPGDSLMRPEPASDISSDQGAQTEARVLGASSFDMPMVVPPPTPGTNGHENGVAGRPPPLDPALFEPEASPVDRAPAEPVKSRIGISQVGRILRRTPPPLVDQRPDVASERAQPVLPAGTPPAAAVPEPQSIVPPSLMSSGSPRPLDPAALSDMARQLETALRRQSSAVTPPPEQSAPAPAPEASAPILPPPPPPAPVAPVEPVIAVAAARPPPSFTMARANPVPPPPVQPPEPKPDPVAAAMAEPSASAPPPAAPEPSPKPAPEAKPAQQPGSTPFTVEEIETEFARLLGRPLDRKS